MSWQTSLLLKITCRVSNTYTRRVHGVVAGSGGNFQGNNKPRPTTLSTWIHHPLSTGSVEGAKLKPPKRPLTAFLQFHKEKRKEIISRNPGLSVQDVSKQLGLLWKELPDSSKELYRGMFSVDQEKYKMERVEYLRTLTDQEKTEFNNRLKIRRNDLQKMRKKKELKSLDKPKRGVNAFLIFCKSQYDGRSGVSLKDALPEISNKWKSMSEEGKKPYLEASEKSRLQYETDIQIWEERMIAEGHPELVRGYKPPGAQKPKKRKVKRVVAKKKKVPLLKIKKKATKAKKSTKTAATKKSSEKGIEKKTKKTVSEDTAWMKEE